MRKGKPQQKTAPLSAILAVVVVIGLAGCDGPVVSPGYVNPASWEFAQAVMAKGPLLLRLGGTPYGIDPPALASIVEREMGQALFWYANPRFSADPATAVGGSFYVSLIFNRGYAGAGQCRLSSLPEGTPLPEGAVTVSAAFCDGPDLIAFTTGSLARSRGPSDPAFAALLQQVTLALFPNPALIPRNNRLGLRVSGTASLSG